MIYYELLQPNETITGEAQHPPSLHTHPTHTSHTHHTPTHTHIHHTHTTHTPHTHHTHTTHTPHTHHTHTTHTPHTHHTHTTHTPHTHHTHTTPNMPKNMTKSSFSTTTLCHMLQKLSRTSTVFTRYWSFQQPPVPVDNLWPGRTALHFLRKSQKLDRFLNRHKRREIF